MLVKAHPPITSNTHEADYGLEVGNKVHYYENGLTAKGRYETSPVSHVNALWVEKPIKVKCNVALTEVDKKIGLQSYASLEANEGLYFPYLPNKRDVTFHQGSVSYPLDLIFLRNDTIVKIEANTKVGSNDRWFCSDVEGVIEVNSGFCATNNVMLGDRIAMFAVSEKDLIDLEAEAIQREANASLDSSEEHLKFVYMPNLVHLTSEIADAL